VNKFPKLVDDDENDTLLFKQWEDHVLKNCPNPERLGCPDYEVLRAFVETPSKVGLTQLHGDHITRCAECTRDLIELRSLREKRLKQATPSFCLSVWWGWRAALAVASLCVIVTIATIAWRNQVREAKRPVQEDQVAQVTLDLSADDFVRGSGGAAPDKPLSLPRGLIELHLILPYYSPVGDYLVTVSPGRDSASLQSQRVNATGQKARTELRVRLDLRGLTAGRYYLGTKYDGESTTYFYPVTIG
jgi:hypothetical protein